MRVKLIPAAALVWLSTALLLLAGGALGAPMKLEARLLWGTNDTKPPEGKDYKPVAPEIQKKLKESPLKWTNWFEVRRVVFTVPQGPAKEVSVSEKCQLNVKNINGNEVEVSLIGKGKEVMKRKQVLPKAEILFLGGNAPNSTAWLVALKRLE